jgi:putative nucleotidyltransferase with HDIG domain
VTLGVCGLLAAALLGAAMLAPPLLGGADPPRAGQTVTFTVRAPEQLTLALRAGQPGLPPAPRSVGADPGTQAGEVGAAGGAGEGVDGGPAQAQARAQARARAQALSRQQAAAEAAVERAARRQEATLWSAWLAAPQEVRFARGQVLAAPGTQLTAFRARLLAAAASRPAAGSGGGVAGALSPADLARLALLGALVALLCWLAHRQVGGGPHPGRRAALLVLLPALSVAALFAVGLGTDWPLGAAPLALGALLTALALGRPAALLVAAGTVALAGVAQAAGTETIWRLGAATLLCGVLVARRRLWTLLPAGLAAAALQAALTAVEPPVPPVGGAFAAIEVLGLAAAGPAVAGAAALVLAGPVLAWAGTASARRLRRLVGPQNLLLRELGRRAPGTFRHSLNVARLAEAGGRALGADVLLLRAAACHHDLGKLVGPELFEENDPSGDDPLRNRSPAEAAHRLRRHVRDGLRLAARYRLPRELRPLLAEHHGTSEVRGPADRARRAGQVVDPTVFHYPGPLPRSRESAILMACDAVEAASRALRDPSLAEASRIVEQVVDRQMSGYQFEECDLSQPELVTLQEALVRALRRGLHRRRPEGEQGQGECPIPPRPEKARFFGVHSQSSRFAPLQGRAPICRFAQFRSYVTPERLPEGAAPGAAGAGAKERGASAEQGDLESQETGVVNQQSGAWAEQAGAGAKERGVSAEQGDWESQETGVVNQQSGASAKQAGPAPETT